VNLAKNTLLVNLHFAASLRLTPMRVYDT